MSRTFDLALRAMYIVLGAGLIVYSIVESTSRMVLYAPVIFGILLIIQGFSGT